MFAHGNSYPSMMASMKRVAMRDGIDVSGDITQFSGFDYDAPFEERHGVSEYRSIDFAMAMLRHWANTLDDGSVQSQPEAVLRLAH